MQSKSAFFASSNDHSIDNFDSTFRKLVLSAYAKRFNSTADARLYLAICGVDLESTVKILLTMKKIIYSIFLLSKLFFHRLDVVILQMHFVL